MNTVVTKERLVRKITPTKAIGRFHGAFEADSARKPIDFTPDENVDYHLLRVLIIDDYRASADTLSMLVAKWGHDVRRAYDGVTGLVLSAAYQPDVLMLDMLMPDVSGFEVATQVRRQGRLQPCFIIAITGRTDAPHRDKCYEAGVDLFLIKPVAPAHMQTLLGLESEHVRRLSKSRTCGTTCSDFAAAY
jgi:PleD family two-component response regulator